MGLVNLHSTLLSMLIPLILSIILLLLFKLMLLYCHIIELREDEMISIFLIIVEHAKPDRLLSDTGCGIRNLGVCDVKLSL